MAASFLLGGGHGGTFEANRPASGPITVGAMGLALVSVLWAYDGWGDLSFAAGEVKDPQRNLPRAIILGTLALIAIYVMTNVAYLYVIPITGISNPKTPLVAADTMMALFGRTGVVLVSVFVMISSFSSLNGSMLASPRVFFAMADDGMFFRRSRRCNCAQDALWRFCWRRSGPALVMSRELRAETFVLAIWRSTRSASPITGFALTSGMLRPHVVGYRSRRRSFILGRHRSSTRSSTSRCRRQLRSRDPPACPSITSRSRDDLFRPFRFFS